MEILSNYIIGVIFAVLTAIISWAAKKHLGIRSHSEIMNYVRKGIGYGKGLAKEKLGENADQLDFDNEIVDKAVSFIARKAPKLLKSAGLAEDDIREFIRSELENDKDTKKE